MTTFDSTALLADYETMKSKYETLCSRISEELSAILVTQAKLSLAMPITTRVKAFDSLLDKCHRNGKSPDKVAEINDIAGIRVVFLFQREEELGRKLIKENLTIINEENTGDRLSSDQFGYGSFHYQVEPKTEWLAVPSMSELGGLEAEIQVRTVSQHIWAEVSHALQYKREAQVPDRLKRPLFRVSALLDLVDLEFERVLENRDQYQKELEAGSLEAKLNPDILRLIVGDEVPLENASDDEDYAQLLDDLTAAGIGTPEELRTLIETNRDRVNKLEAAALETTRAEVSNGKQISDSIEERLAQGVFYSRVDLVNLALTPDVEV